MHADETSVRLKKEKGYVWVFTNLNDVVYVYKDTREGQFLHEMLKDFSGHCSVIPTAHAAHFLPHVFGSGGDLAAWGTAGGAALAACCQNPSSSRTTQRTTHRRFRHR